MVQSNRSTYGYLLPSVSMDIFPYFLKTQFIKKIRVEKLNFLKDVE